LLAAAEERRGGLPVVLAAHLAVGRETDFTGQERGTVVGGEACVEPGTLGTGWDYVALGHIHRPQFVKGTGGRARYCGSPMPMDFDEARHPHGVDVVEIAGAGAAPVVRTVRFEPLRALHTLGGEEGRRFGELLEEIPRAGLAEGSYVRLRVALGAGETAEADWEARARAAAAAAGLRYGRIRRVEAAGEAEAGSAPRGVTIEELRELSDERVVELLAAARNLTPGETELLRGVLADLAGEGRGEEGRAAP